MGRLWLLIREIRFVCKYQINQFPSRDREFKHHVCRLVFSFNIKYIQYFYFYLNFSSCYFFSMICLLQIFIKSFLRFPYSLQCIFCILKCYLTSDFSNRTLTVTYSCCLIIKQSGGFFLERSRHHKLKWKSTTCGNVKMIASDLKEKVTPISLPFLFLPMASKHSALPLTKVSASEVPAILKKFILKGTTLGTAILKVYLEVRLCVCGVVPSHLNLWRGEKPTTELVFFFSSEYPLHYLHCYHIWSLFGSK